MTDCVDVCSSWSNKEETSSLDLSLPPACVAQNRNEKFIAVAETCRDTHQYSHSTIFTHTAIPILTQPFSLVQPFSLRKQPISNRELIFLNCSQQSTCMLISNQKHLCNRKLPENFFPVIFVIFSTKNPLPMTRINFFGKILMANKRQCQPES
jgi:hypothetical protein